jgi:uncharacterized membrane protein YcaP (DUF421 family)
MFETSTGQVLEIVARVAIIYVACMVLLRISGRREMSELSPMDLLAMLLLSETVSPALTAGDESVTAGVVAATTLIGLCVATGWLSFKSRKFERIVQGEAAVLVHDGVVRPAILRRYRISADDLETALHQQGLLSVAEVARAFIEPDGEITIVKRKDHEESLERLHR